MFDRTGFKRTHELVADDILLYDGHYYAVKTATRLGPTMTTVVMAPVCGVGLNQTAELHSDLNITLFDWK